MGEKGSRLVARCSLYPGKEGGRVGGGETRVKLRGRRSCHTRVRGGGGVGLGLFWLLLLLAHAMPGEKGAREEEERE